MNKDEWQKKCQQLRELRRKIFDQGDQLTKMGLIVSYYSDYLFNIVLPRLTKETGMNEFQLMDFMAYHIMIGSSNSYEKKPIIDTPDGKIEEFNHELLKAMQEFEKTGISPW